MSDRIALDSSPVSTLCHPDEQQPHVKAIREWLEARLLAGATVYLPEIVDYEVRREFVRRRNAKSLRRLDALAVQIEYLPLTTEMMRRAAELWAVARQQGFAPAPPEALDADVILAAQAESVGATVATVNARHLARFVPADAWQNIG